MKQRMLCIGLCLAACGRQERLPEGVLDRERFTRVMVGMTLIEARVSREMMVVPSEGPLAALYCRELLDEHGIDSAAFRRSFDHYAARPDEMRAIYDEVVERLRVMKDERVQGAVLRKDTALATDSASGMN